MYAGHFAAGLAIKATEPRVPTWAVLLGVGFVDILFGLFLLLGIERAHLTPGQSPGFALDFIDWSHSLLMCLVWAGLFAVLFRGRGTAVAAWCAEAPDGERDLEPLFDILRDRAKAADADLPATGIPLDRERLLSAPFIVSDIYGTRCSTVLTIGKDGAARFVERSFDPAGGQTGEVAFRFAVAAKR